MAKLLPQQQSSCCSRPLATCLNALLSLIHFEIETLRFKCIVTSKLRGLATVASRMMNKQSWTLSVSTLLTNELRVAGFLDRNREALGEFDEVLIVCQRKEHSPPISAIGSLPNHARVIQVPKMGISASRNAGIQNFKTDLIWFMDDDTVLSENLSEVKRLIFSSPAEVNCLRIQDISSERLYKVYGEERNLSALELLKVSSIEITCKREAFRKAPLKFAEWLGIGTALPGGEENLFLKSAYSAGCQVRHLPVVGCRHPFMAGDIRSIWMRPNRMYAMGIVASEYGAVGLLLCLRWSVRAFGLEVSRGRIRELWSGYFEGVPR